MRLALGQAADVRLGRQRAPQYEVGDNVVSYLRSANVGDGFISLEDVKQMNFTPVEQAIFRLEIGDVLVTEGSGSRDTVGTSAVWHGELDAPICFQNTLLRIRPRPGITDGRYLAWWARHARVSGQIAAVSSGANILHIGSAGLKRLEVHVPPLSEQRRIADFLDDRVSRIDRIIAARREQMVQLCEAERAEKAAFVFGRGDNWVASSLRRFVTSQDGTRVPLSSEERARVQGGYPYYGASGVIDHVDGFLFDGPRILVSEDGANLLARRLPIAFVADGRYWVNNHAHVFQPHDGAHHFWAARVEALDVSPWVSGSAQPKLTVDAALSLPVSAPQSAKRRRDIGKLVKDVSSAAEARRTSLTSSINLLTEYKSSLITAAVTGELDVTTAGSNIPG